MKYPHWFNPDTRQDMKDSMMEQAIDNIYNDPERIEAYIQENADVIQDIIFRHGGYKEIKEIEAQTILTYKIGKHILNWVLLGIEDMAEEDVEHQI